MDLKELRELTAPCGLDCFNCNFYLANDNEKIRKQIQAGFSSAGCNLPDEGAVCKGCRRENGNCAPRRALGLEPCKVLKCIGSKDIESCADCSDFPCDNLHPYADLASVVPHNTKVFNLALIRKMGLEKWAQEKAKSVRETYFNQKFDI
ncbi:MAG: DUF3795 domain-containing protein [Methanosarcina sp.]|jgi:hypothetical protein